MDKDGHILIAFYKGKMQSLRKNMQQGFTQLWELQEGFAAEQKSLSFPAVCSGLPLLSKPSWGLCFLASGRSQWSPCSPWEMRSQVLKGFRVQFKIINGYRQRPQGSACPALCLSLLLSDLSCRSKTSYHFAEPLHLTSVV